MYKIAFFSLILLLGCFSNSSSQTILNPIKVYKLNISEPSGISFYKDHLFIVSDSKKHIYKTSLKGKIVSKIKTDIKDVEGIAVVASGKFFLVDENKRRLIEIDSKGGILRKIKIKGKQESKNSGLEGICFVPDRNFFFVVNEDSPKQVLKIDNKGEIIDKVKIDFAKDLSGICYDKSSNSLWIVSDESKKLYNISKKGKLLSSFKLPIKKAEGIVLKDNKIFIVSDAEDKLYIFEKPKNVSSI